MTGALQVLLAPAVTTTSITHSYSKIQNGDILVLAKWLLKWRKIVF